MSTLGGEWDVARRTEQTLAYLAPWTPIAILLASTSIAFVLRSQEFGGGLTALAWVSAATAAAVAGARSPDRALIALVFLLPITPYFRYDTWLGQALPSVILAAVLVGVALSSEANWGQLVRDRRRPVSTPVLTFAALLGVSTLLVLLQRSPLLFNMLGREEVGGFFTSAWPTLRPQTSVPIDRSGGVPIGSCRWSCVALAPVARESEWTPLVEPRAPARSVRIDQCPEFRCGVWSGLCARLSDPNAIRRWTHGWSVLQSGRTRAAHDTRNTCGARFECSPDPDSLDSPARGRHRRACCAALHSDSAVDVGA